LIEVEEAYQEKTSILKISICDLASEQIQNSKMQSQEGQGGKMMRDQDRNGIIC
jgi:hypothetical protein